MTEADKEDADFFIIIDVEKLNDEQREWYLAYVEWMEEFLKGALP